MKQNDLSLRVFDFFQHGLQAVFEFAAILRARQHRSQIERDHALVLQNFGHVAGDDALRQAFDDGGLAHARLADQHRIILGAPRKHLHHAANFLVASDHRDRACRAAPARSGRGIALQRLVFRFRILVGDALRSADRGQRLQDGVVRRAVTRQQFLRRIALQILVSASSRCSVETYSSLKVSASLKDFSSSWLTCDDMAAAARRRCPKLSAASQFLCRPR
jgi:hypothetical protein